jgi:hypothetical protein
MLLSVERPFAESLAVLIPRAMLRHGNGLVPAVLPASTEHGERTLGVPQEPRRCCRFLCEIPAGDTGLTTPGLGGALTWRLRSAEVFVPLAHPPFEAQVDFRQAEVVPDGLKAPVALFVMTLPYCGDAERSTSG